MLTTILDLVGLLLVVLAAGVWLWAVSPALAIGVCGALLLAVSMLIDRWSR